MIPEIGQFALILALVIALVQATLPLYGSLHNIPAWINLAKPTALCQFLLVLIAFASLTWSSITSDFSVAYIANNSNSRLPLIYRISGVWGGHEGSLLLWALIQTIWTVAVSMFSRNVPSVVVARVLAVLGMINFGFLLFMLVTSNPFERMFPIPLEGRDLNPLLQDIGLALHPPMLYMGYVGFSVAFAFAMAALIGGRVDAAWARWVRPWTNLAWMFLTLGIAIGSWWAYYELGWGGWWFWDPVENASFMPWLIGTALIHSLAATEKRGVFKAWSVLLAIFTFSLSLLGMFLVRSGVLTSVHAFASDPLRGMFMLIFLAAVIGGSLTLYSIRAPAIVSRVRFGLVSREMGLLINNIFLSVLCFTVLVGTLYPLVLDALGGDKISVGRPYFDLIFVAIGLPLMAFVGLGALLRWKKDKTSRLQPKLVVPLAISITAGLALPLLMGNYSFNAAVGIAAGFWIILNTLMVVLDRTKPGRRLQGLKNTPQGVYGMIIAHIGVGIFIIGITYTNAYSVEKDLRMTAGETFTVSGYDFEFKGVENIRGANYDAARGEFRVTRNQQLITNLKPENRTYLVQQNPMTEAAIDPGLTRDLFVALSEPLGTTGAWAVRIHVKPFIRFIWLGTLLMALGGVVAATDKRYRRQRVRRTAIQTDPAVAST